MPWEHRKRNLAPDAHMVHLVEGKQQKMDQYRKTLTDSIAELEDALDFQRRVHLAYIMLPQDQYLILKKLYTEHIPWKQLSDETGIPKGQILRLRQTALDTIRRKIEEPEE